MNASQNHAATMRPVDRPRPTSSAKASGIAQRDQDRPRDFVPRDPGEAVREHHRHEGELRIHPRFGDADDGSTLDRPRRPRFVDEVHIAHGLIGLDEPQDRDEDVHDRERDPQHCPLRHPLILGRAGFEVVADRWRGSAGFEGLGDRARERLGDIERGDRTTLGTEVARDQTGRAAVQPHAGRREGSEVGVRMPRRRRPRRSRRPARPPFRPSPATASRPTTVVAQPLGDATIVTAPFRTTVAPSAAAVSIADAARSASVVGEPSARPRSRSQARVLAIVRRDDPR